MRQLTTALLCSLLFPACLTTGIWDWAGDTQPVSPRPIHCGVDTDGTIVILVAIADEEQPAFCLRVPANWRGSIQLTVGTSGGSIHSPIFLKRWPVPAGALNALVPAPEEWFLNHEPGTASIDVLVADDGGYIVVGTAELPRETHWGRRLTAAILTPVTVAVDSVVRVSAFLFVIWIALQTAWSY